MAIEKIKRYEGAMLGVAIGDALGAPLEFMSADEIKRKHGNVREIIGGGWLNILPGEVTDDTQMTLAVAEGIAVADMDGKAAVYRKIGENFLRWFRTSPKDIGGCCRGVLATMSRGQRLDLAEWHRAAEAEDKATNGRTAGNGALMRTVYPALYYQGDEALDTASDIAKMTHWHEHSTKAVRQYVAAITSIVNSEWTVKEARDNAELIMSDARKILLGKEAEPTGYSIESLVCAMDAIKATSSFDAAMIKAVNLGGDADTIGAITGGLAGAIYGADTIPMRWINSLANQPNRKTVRLFYQSEGADQQGNANTLGIRLLDLAHIAYRKNYLCL